MSTGYLLSNGSRYLERRPYNGQFDWLAGLIQHATPLTRACADAMATALIEASEDAVLHIEIIPDPMGREGGEYEPN